MKFKLYCSIHKKDGKYHAVADFLVIQNILLSKDDIDQSEMEHEFVVVVNKRGQLTVLCIK